MSYFKNMPQMGMTTVLRQGPRFRRQREGPSREQERFQEAFRQRGPSPQGKEPHEEMMSNTQQ